MPEEPQAVKAELLVDEAVQGLPLRLSAQLLEERDLGEEHRAAVHHGQDPLHDPRPRRSGEEQEDGRQLKTHGRS